MKKNAIQVAYEEGIDSLPQIAENKLLETIETLLTLLKQEQRILSLFFCTPETVTQLNHTYRGKNKPTDLLSWLYEADDEELISPEDPWGELVYCLPVIRDQAASSGWDLQDELIRLTVHGLVHLMGYDHECDADEAEMLGIEKQLLEQIGLAGVYPV